VQLQFFLCKFVFSIHSISSGIKMKLYCYLEIRSVLDYFVRLEPEPNTVINYGYLSGGWCISKSNC